MKNFIIIVLLLILFGGGYYLFVYDNSVDEDNKTSLNRELENKAEEIYDVFLGNANNNNFNFNSLYVNEYDIDSMPIQKKLQIALLNAENDVSYTNVSMAEHECQDYTNNDVIYDYDKCGIKSISVEDITKSYEFLFNEKLGETPKFYTEGFTICVVNGDRYECYLILGGYTENLYYTVNYITDIESYDDYIIISEDVLFIESVAFDDLYVVSSFNEDRDFISSDYILDNSYENRLYSNKLTNEESKKILDNYEDNIIKYEHTYVIESDNVGWYKTKMVN